MSVRSLRGLLAALFFAFSLSTTDGDSIQSPIAGTAYAQQLYRLPDGRIVRLKPGQRIRRVRRNAPARTPGPKKSGGFGGFLKSLFGGPKLKSGVRYTPPASQDYLNRYVKPGSVTPAQPRGPKRIPGYRTMCVRLCDGYYFPISFSTTRSNFGRDERTCRNSCNSDAVLFYMKPHSTDASKLVDRRGRSYSKLKNAFVYRKSYKPQCQCRPDPWTDAAKNRHSHWIKAATERKARARQKDASILGISFDAKQPASGIIEPKSVGGYAKNEAATISDDASTAMLQTAESEQQNTLPIPLRSQRLSTPSPKANIAPIKRLQKITLNRPSTRTPTRHRKEKAIRPNWSLNAGEG